MKLFGLHKVRMLVALCMIAAFAMPAFGAGQDSSAEWPSYGNDPGGQRHSPLDQINRNNVAQLKVAWTYHTGDVSNGSHTKRKTSFENTPIVVDGTMYLSTPFNRVIALDPATGHEKWTFDPKIDLQASYSEGLINRGVSSWVDTSRAPGQPCARRIFIATIDARLIALDAATGIACSDFGVNGQINLKTSGISVQTVYNGEYEETSPPAIIDDLVVVGSAIGDNTRVNEPPGMVRAFDTRTGALRWSFNPIPKTADDPGWKEWKPEQAQTTGAANVWSIISVDPQNDLVFLPGASASPDYYGGDRLGSNLYAYALVALHPKTGKIPWALQTTHHNLWDYDLPSIPLLCTLPHWRSRDVDPKRQLFVTTTNNLIREVHLIPRDQFTERATSLTRGFGVEYTEQNGTPYGMSRVIMLSSLGFPCNPPPWGSLTAVDLSSGQIKWSVPLGNILGTSKIGSILPDPGWGTPNFGGGIVTAGGLVFIGASMDPAFRAFDVQTGKLLWKTELAAGGQATPMTYKAGDNKSV